MPTVSRQFQSILGRSANPARPLGLRVMPLESASTPRTSGIYPPVTITSFRYLEVKVPASMSCKHQAAGLRLACLKRVAL